MAHLQCWAGPALRLLRSPATAATAALQFTRAEQSKAAQNGHDRWHSRGGSSWGQTIWSKVQLGPFAAASLASQVISTAWSRSAKATYAAS